MNTYNIFIRKYNYAKNANIDHTLLNRNKTSAASTTNPNLVKKEYKPINSYKPTGNLVYSNDFLKKIDERMNN